MYYNFDVKKLARMLLPPVLRKRTLLAFIDTLVESLSFLAGKISDFAESTLLKMS